MKIFQKGLSTIKNTVFTRDNLPFFLVFCYAAISLSLWSNYIVTELLGFPFFIYELYFIPLIAVYIFRNGYKPILHPTQRLMFFGCVLLICLILGIFANTEYILAQITTYRVWFYFLIIIELCRNAKKLDVKILYFASLGAVTGDLLYSIISPLNYQFNPTNLVAMAIAVAIPLIYGKYPWLILSLILGVSEAFLSGFRIGFVVILVSFGCSMLFTVFSIRSKKIIGLLCATVICGVLFIIFFDEIATAFQKIFHIKNFAFFRVTTRLKALFTLDFVTSQDSERIANFKIPFTVFFDRFFIRGLIGKATNQYGVYKDVPIVFLYDSFGAVPAWIISAYFVYLGVKKLILSYKARYSKELGFLGVMFPVFLLLYLTNGCFIMDTYEVCFTAFVLGFWFNKNIPDSASKKSSLQLRKTISQH